MPTKPSLVGEAELRRRLQALADTSGNRAMLQQLGNIVVVKAQAEAARKTGELQGSIRVDEVSDTHVLVGAHAAHAPDVEYGTQAHPIVPRRRRALRFAASSGGQRLSGSPRRGAGVVFARRVLHPGTQPQPFMRPALEEAERVMPGVVAQNLIGRWNGAA